MRPRILVGAFILVGTFALGTVATSGDGLTRGLQQAVVYLPEHTLIGSTIVKGPVVFTHDDAAMVRGEPCTRIYLFEPGKSPAEELTSFHCIPTPRNVVHKFTVITRPNEALGFGCVLVEYQFAGDREGHGVPPATANVN